MNVKFAILLQGKKFVGHYVKTRRGQWGWTVLVGGSLIRSAKTGPTRADAEKMLAFQLKGSGAVVSLV